MKLHPDIHKARLQGGEKEDIDHFVDQRHLKTPNMGTVQEMVKSAKTTGNLPVLRFGPSTSQVISLEIFSK